jgi:hypothetical protein
MSQHPYEQQPGGYPPQYPQQHPPQYPQQYPPQYPHPYYTQPRTTNGLAIASMVLGILWIYWVGSVLALIFGYVARRQIRERNQSGGGMATAGIVLGWIGVATFCLMLFLVAMGGASDSGSSY